MTKTKLKIVTPTTVLRTVPKRPPNAKLRSREYLTPDEVGKLMTAARKNRYGHRDATMILVCWRHGLRASELVELRWDQLSWDQAELHVLRKKGSKTSNHPIRGDELRALRQLRRDNPDSPFMFVSERGAPFTRAGFARMVERAGRAAKLGSLKVHAHMLRHAAGFKLANDGHDTRSLQAYLGHANIQHTVKYTDITAARFKDFWR